jgi:hypothetical protein
MAWIVCDRCGYWFSEDEAHNKGKVYHDGYEVGDACNYCQEVIYGRNTTTTQ